MTRLLHGRPVAAEVNADTARRAAALRASGRVPALTVVTAGADPAAATYLGRLERDGRAAGIEVRRVTLPRGADEGALRGALEALGADASVTGVLLLTPLPAGIELATVVESIPAEKDVEGMHPLNAGFLAEGRPRFVPTTAAAVIALLRHYAIPLRGCRVTVVGRSAVFGRPLASLLLLEHATVTVAHSQTPDLAVHTRTADIVTIGIGRAGALRGDMIAKGCVVIDAGINVTPDGIVGDADAASVSQVAGAYSPVPGGLGAVTTALLLRNVVLAAEQTE
ncbi:MAG TPA: bifunctional 5,10-methylenetetrahydrofolate dehydrogenase/5,10-methenyltetrahydrofolate cyclohydrolase [Candidatus Limnocylindria bacterium]|nr:bifunctional 5,10-methylenetetrahydrofolate dehydrogenase/5,10-methenyltetrahydrofolate cyclohydrolase [Candidatus Limnocylindria bacterium]